MSDFLFLSHEKDSLSHTKKEQVKKKLHQILVRLKMWFFIRFYSGKKGLKNGER